MGVKPCNISCIVYTLNEELNLGRCLKSLSWCDDVVVVDSFSTDLTETIARAAGARFFQHPFTGFGDQRNWSLSEIKFKHKWVLILDADESTPQELATEMIEKVDRAVNEVAAFRLRRRFHLWGKWMRFSGLYPTWVVRLIRLGRVKYVNRGHAETQVVEGATEALDFDLIDENLKNQHEWWDRQNRYSTKEALYENSMPPLKFKNLISADPLQRRDALKALSRRLPARPLWYFVYTYFFRLGFLDGRTGFQFCLMKMMYLEMIELKKAEIKLMAGEPRRAVEHTLAEEDLPRRTSVRR